MSAALDWIVGNDTGMSSKAIWAHMMGADPRERGYGVAFPHDPDDFGRCYRLLMLEPAWAARLGEMAKYSAEWAALAARWAELTAMYEAAAKSGRDWKRWRPLYDVMHDLLTAARVCVDCGTVGMNAWTTYEDGTKRCYRCCEQRRATA